MLLLFLEKGMVATYRLGLRCVGFGVGAVYYGDGRRDVVGDDFVIGAVDVGHELFGVLFADVERAIFYVLEVEHVIFFLTRVLYREF